MEIPLRCGRGDHEVRPRRRLSCCS